jgi:hypothetical protein
MSDEATAVLEKETATETTETVVESAVETATETDNQATETVTETATETETETETEKKESDWPDDWRERMAAGDEDLAKIINRYGSPRSLAKALKDAKDTIRSGKLKRDMPDASDEKAMAEWRKEQGIPDDPSGYQLPDEVTKLLTDHDKPLIANFTEFMHREGATNAEVARAAKWYTAAMEDIQAQQIETDRGAAETAEEALRKEWAHGEYKANLTLGKRFIESIPGVGADWTEARLPDGRRLGDIPDFVMWAAEQGRDRFGDVTFANSDSEKRHSARKSEIEALMKEDINKYYETGADKEYAQILERESKRRS